MIIKRSKILKYIIAGCIGIIFILAVSNINKVYASSIGILGANSIEVYTSPILYVGSATRSGDWSVYTKNSGKYPNNNILTVTKKTVKNGHTGKTESYIICHGKNAGTARVYVKDGVTGVVGYKDITVTRRDITKSWIDLSQTSYTYDGGEKKPTVYSVTLNGVKIENYRVRYVNNIKAGIATVYVDGLGNNCGSAWRQFSINKRDISGGTITLNQPSYTYYGGKIKPGIKKVTLANGRTQVFDYKVEYGENIYAGTGWVRVTGINNNTGSITKYFTINKRDISEGNVNLSQQSYVFTGFKIEPKVTEVYMANNKTKINDYKVTYGKNIDCNNKTNWVKVEGINNNSGHIIKYFTIKPLDITGGKIVLNKSYSGKTKPTRENMQAYTSKGNPVYEFEVVNEETILDSNKGKLIVKIRGKGNYTGSIAQNFSINGKTRQDLVAFLESQLEKTGENSQTYFGVDRDTDWCCFFVGYCIDSVLGKGSAMNKLGLIKYYNETPNKNEYASDAGSIARSAERMGTLHRYGTYEPKPGDIFITCTSDTYRIHVGFIIKNLGNGYYQTIEGNSDYRIMDSDPYYARKTRVTKNIRTKRTKGTGMNDQKQIKTLSGEDAYMYGFVDVGKYFSD